MGIEFDGKGNGINGGFFVRRNETPKEPPKIETVDVKATDNKPIGEYGEKLLDQVQPRFITAARIPEADAVELTEMYAMAGIKAPKMPTVAQYASISNHVTDFTRGIDDLDTTNNAQALFNSDEFRILDDIFGIS